MGKKDLETLKLKEVGAPPPPALRWLWSGGSASRCQLEPTSGLGSGSFGLRIFL